MSLKITNHNPYPDCAGLEQSVPQGMETGDTFPLVVELICGWQALLWKNVTFRMGLREGTLHVRIENAQIEKGSRYADEARKQRGIERVITQRHQQTTAAATIGTDLELEPHTVRGALTGRASLGRVSTKSTQRSTISDKPIFEVQAGGTTDLPSWTIKAIPGEDALQGRQLGPQDLCRIKCSTDSIRITTTFKCLPCDFAVKDVHLRRGKIWGWSRNKQALITRLIAGLLETEQGIEVCKSVLSNEKD